ncbi:MAG: hypothetical protein ACTSYD_06845 [Candidatus Heimdallarchaeaceae archaeon]
MSSEQKSEVDEIKELKKKAKKEIQAAEAMQPIQITQAQHKNKHGRVAIISYYISESVVFWWIGFLLLTAIKQYESFESFSFTGFMGLVTIPLLIIGTILYLFVLNNEQRVYGYIIRLISILSLTSFSALAIPYFVTTPWDYSGMPFFYVNWFILYASYSQFILKTYLVATKKSYKMLFKKAIAGSPAELEWRKYDTRSGIYAILTGIFLLQPLWLIYHFAIRKAKIERVKKRLIIESLQFGQEVNLSTIALELGIPLEEVIFYLKQMNLKRELIVDFTRYGAILQEIRKTKWFTSIVQEKYERFIKEKKLSALESHIEKLFALAERYKVSVEDFRKVMKLKENVSLKDFELLLPANSIEVKKPLFSKKRWVFFNADNLLMKKEKIISILTQEGENIFEL